METIFDHNVTKEEIESLLGYIPDKDVIIKKGTQDAHYMMIYRLFRMRGLLEEAKKYFKMVKNTDYKYFTLGNHCVSEKI